MSVTYHFVRENILLTVADPRFFFGVGPGCFVGPAGAGGSLHTRANLEDEGAGRWELGVGSTSPNLKI